MIKHIYCLRETEIVDKFSCNSSCSPGCHIFYEKHNWSRSRSQELLERFNNIQNIGCNSCDQSFSKKSDVEKHIKTCHIVDRGVDSVEKVAELEKDDQVTTILVCEKEELNDVDLVKNSSEIEHFVNYPGNSEYSKEMCKICLLSFTSDTELKQHVIKHKRTAPSILKK